MASELAFIVNDPSAGSPTETLLRLHLPLIGRIYIDFPDVLLAEPIDRRSPENSPWLSIGRCDGRCVQRAGT